VLAAFLGSAATLALAAPASAEENERRLVILVDPGAPTLARRLREEVEALGLEVRSVPVVEPDVSLDERARSSGAVAAIRIAPSGKDAVEMTIVDRATGKTVQRRLAIATPSDPASAELIATRTVELLRASLMELAATHPARGDVVVPAEVTESVVRETQGSGEFSFGLGPALVFGAGAPALLSGWVSLSIRTSSGFGITAEWLPSLGGTELSVAEGSVKLSASEYRLGAFYETPAFGPGFSGRVLAGGLLLHLALEGETQAPYVGAQDDLVAGGAWLGAELRFAVTRYFGVLVRGDAAVTAPLLVVRSAGREVATAGRLLGATVLGLEVSWQ
jgi:hypothetical protein